MFSGLVEAIGVIRRISVHSHPAWILIEIPSVDFEMKVGDSLAVNGVCLTVDEIRGKRIGIHLGPDTVRDTAFSDLHSGQRVHLERSLRVDGRLGGHFVQGHVDGIGIVGERKLEAGSLRLMFHYPNALRKYIVKKGSIAIDGVSITVQDLITDAFLVTLIPQTLKDTLFSLYRNGQRVNLEVDILSKYVESMLLHAD